MQVFNPGTVPVVVDDGLVVPALEHADMPDGPRLRAAVDAGALTAIEATEPDVAEPDDEKTSRRPRGDR